MNLRKFRLLDDADASGSGGAAASPQTLLNGGAPTTPAAGQAAPAGDASASAPAPQADANQQPPTGDAAPAKPDEAAAPPAKVVPEKYEFKTPDGAPLEGEFLGEFSGIAKELGLTQEQADKVAELGVKMTKGYSEQLTQAIQKQAAEWEAESRADEEFGGDKLTENLAIAEKALANLGTPKLSELLKKSNLANHPEVIRLMVKVGKAISQDSTVITGSRMTTIESAAQRMYPNMKP